MLSSVFCHAEYLRSWDLCLSCWISQTMGSVCDVWISQVWGSVSAMLNISGLNICVFCVNYLSPQDLCHPLVKISHLQGCVNHRENLRYLSLCQMCRISQSLKSVSHMPENSEPKSVSTWWIPQYSWSVSNVKNISESQVCVSCAKYLRHLVTSSARC